MENLLKINLSNYPERFAENNKEFSVSNKINFIFGKNGTGKTTIADAIREQFSDIYNVAIFKDFEGVIGENNRLNAVALGTNNAKIQTQIDEIDKEINKIKEEIDEPANGFENLFIIAKKAEDYHRRQGDKIDSFFFRSAQKIKNQTKPQIAKASYFKNDFKDEIKLAKLISDEEIKKHKETIKSDEMENIKKTITFPNIDFSILLKTTNEILQSSVSQHQIVDELKDNTDKQNFAKEGLRIHKHKSGEKCAFCGNEISRERWQLLGNYFNDEVKKLEKHIKQNTEIINGELSKLEVIKDLNSGDFYDKFNEQIKSLNLKIKNTKNEHKIFLENLKTALNNKTKNLFINSKELKPIIPVNFSKDEKSYEKIIEENNNFSRHLISEQEKAKNALRYHEIKKALDNFKYDVEKTYLENFKTLKDEAQKNLTDKKEELRKKINTKNELILQTKDENKIATKINKLLKTVGFVSFVLELVDDKNESQKGQYRIKRWYHKESEFDEVENLSKGEKNIIAFLYFMFSLEKIDNNDKPKIIILDDPMTSNDDTMQYLMIGAIQELYRNINDNDYFILLTHNCHFYLNTRPNTSAKYKCGDREISFYKKYGNYHMLSNGKHTSIKNIENGKQDFKTNYGLLWKEIHFLYKEDDATADIMLNPFRKICETYMKFNCIGIDKFFENNRSIKKLYDVNQHSIDDLEAEQNGKTKEEIKTMLEEIFKKNNAIEHFNKYWQ